MGKTIRVTPEKLEEAAGTLSGYSETYTEIYKQLFQEAETMGEAWKGEDNLAFVEQIKGFTEELNSMAQQLVVDSEVLQKQAEAYRKRQEDNVSQVRKLTN